MSSGTLYWLVIAIVLAEYLWSTVLTLLNIRASRLPAHLSSEVRFSFCVLRSNARYSFISGAAGP